jgi:hypothetical protein
MKATTFATSFSDLSNDNIKSNFLLFFINFDLSFSHSLTIAGIDSRRYNTIFSRENA